MLYARKLNPPVAAAAALLAAWLGTSCTRAPAAQRREERAAAQQTAFEHSTTSAPPPATVAEPALPPVQRLLPYPRGRWRLAPPEDLNTVVLWFSHILIRYQGVLDAGVSFCPFDWSSAYPASNLGRDEALRLAQQVAHEAAAGKIPFAALVAAHSEDITTVGRGGSLGGMTALQLEPWGQILDALAVLGPGQTSEVVETPYGFHILQKQAPPPEQAVSGARIVIAHDAAPALRYFHFRGDIPHRSRAEAEALASQVYERARRNPDDFADLVERHSEHMDASAQGDIGEWSTREPLAPAREIETLAQLRVGEVAPPIDTFLGFQILMRTPNRERPQLAHDAVELLYNPTAPDGHPESEAVVYERARELAARLREPEQFDLLRAELCCMDTHVWREGRREKGIYAAVSALSIGEIATTPVRTVSSYAFVRRLDPSRVPPAPAASFELPSRATPDTGRFLGWLLDPGTAGNIVRSLGRLVADELRLQGERRVRLLELHEIRSGLGVSDERVQAVATITNGTKQLLEPTEYATYTAFATRLVEEAVLSPASAPGGG